MGVARRLRGIGGNAQTSTVGEGLAPPEKTKTLIKNGSTKALPYRSPSGEGVSVCAKRNIVYAAGVWHHALACIFPSD